MKKASCIIQARVGSTRLPGKVLLKILDKTILEYVIERVKAAEAIDNVVVATSTEKEDRQIVNLVKGLGVNLFCGSELDVLDRFYQAARFYNMQDIVRITADCPLIDPGIIDDVVNRYFSREADYCCNIINRKFPDGEDVEIFNFFTLEEAWKRASLPSEREHVIPYIRKHPETFKMVNLEAERDYSEKRWTLDRGEDFEFIKAVIESLYPIRHDFRMEDILKFLRDNPHLEEINKGIISGEGYQRSLEEDRDFQAEAEKRD